MRLALIIARKTATAVFIEPKSRKPSSVVSIVSPRRPRNVRRYVFLDTSGSAMFLPPVEV
jgi:hypothetical protein